MKNILLYLGLIIGTLLISGCAPLHSTSKAQYSNNKQYNPNYRYLPPQRQQMMKIAHQSIGTRYKWGGKNPREGFDCSGLMQYTYKLSGIRIPRTAAQQRDASQRISRSHLRPGDMVFFKTGQRSNHVGIYTGNGYFIHASSGSKRVKKEKLDKRYWNQHLTKYGAFL